MPGPTVQKKRSSRRSISESREVLPQAPPAQNQEDLARHEIKDRLAHGGMSDLERQHRLATDVFMTDEDRSAYAESLSRATPPQQQLQAEVSVGSETAPPAQSHGPGLKLEALDLKAVEAPLPPKGPFANMHTQTFKPEQLPPKPEIAQNVRESFGAEGGLAPQGLLTPKGLLIRGMGMLEGPPRGLMSPKSVGSPGGSNFKPAQSSTKQAQAPRQAPRQAPAASAGMQKGASPMSNSEAKMHFQPVQLQSSIPSPWQKRGRSPLEEIFSKFIQIIKTLLGFGQGGYRGGRAELGKK